MDKGVCRNYLRTKDLELHSCSPETTNLGCMNLSLPGSGILNSTNRLGTWEALTFVIVLILDVPGEPKVPQLHTLRGGHQDVPDSNVPERRIED